MYRCSCGLMFGNEAAYVGHRGVCRLASRYGPVLVLIVN